ncbi:MAG: DedA family protein [Acidimicrobiales bacterium]
MSATTGQLEKARTALLVLAGLRTVLGIVAIPLVPVLWDDHFVFLVLLRPTKEILLAAGFLFRQGDVSLIAVLVAAVPLAIFGVWLFYGIGRAFADEIQSGKGLPKVAARFLPRDRIQDLCRILDRKGRGVVVAGRLAAFPSSLLGAAAGASRMEPRAFLPADTIGAVLSIAEVIGAGYVLGEAYKRAGPWLTAVGVAILFGILFVVGRWLKREEKRGNGRKKAGAGASSADRGG